MKTQQQTTHTPGPWKIHLWAEHTDWPCYDIDSPDGKRIAQVEPVEDGNDEAPLPTEQIAANARLIAAAPDLAEALKHLQEALAVRADYWQNDPDQFGYLLDALDAARDALAKLDA